MKNNSTLNIYTEVYYEYILYLFKSKMFADGVISTWKYFKYKWLKT